MIAYNEHARAVNKPLLTQRYAPVSVFNQDEFEYRPVTEGNKDKSSIIFFGCSYTEGAGLEYEETLPYLIGKKSGRTVINRGVGGGGILNTLHDLNNPEFYNEISKYPAPEYIFYIWINDQFYRIYNPFMASVTPSDNPMYRVRVLFKEKNGRYVEDNPGFFKRFLYHFYTVKAFYYFYSQTMSKDTPEKRMTEYLKEAARTASEKFPNSKFIVIEYKDGSHRLMPDEVKQELENSGILIYDSEELAGHELESIGWRGSDKEHPNAAAFEDISNGLIKKLNLRP